MSVEPFKKNTELEFWFHLAYRKLNTVLDSPEKEEKAE